MHPAFRSRHKKLFSSATASAKIRRVRFDIIGRGWAAQKRGQDGAIQFEVRRMNADVAEDKRWRRFRLLEDLQAAVATSINSRYLGQTVEVLFEQNVRGRWTGRTEINELVFIGSVENLPGRLAPVEITRTRPWSLQGRVPSGRPAESVPLDAAIYPTA